MDIPNVAVRYDMVVTLFYSTCRSSAVGIATDYGLDGSEVEFGPQKGKEFSLLHIVQTGSGSHLASYPMGTGRSFLGVKRQGCEADHSLPTSAEIKKTLIYISVPYRSPCCNA
jgi:hypothetical protein